MYAYNWTFQWQQKRVTVITKLPHCSPFLPLSPSHTHKGQVSIGKFTKTPLLSPIIKSPAKSLMFGDVLMVGA